MLRELSVVEQRYQAVLAVVEDRLSVTEVAAKVGVLRRYADGGLEALADRSHRPVSCPHQMPLERDRAPDDDQLTGGGVEACDDDVRAGDRSENPADYDFSGLAVFDLSLGILGASRTVVLRVLISMCATPRCGSGVVRPHDLVEGAGSSV